MAESSVLFGERKHIALAVLLMIVVLIAAGGVWMFSEGMFTGRDTEPTETTTVKLPTVEEKQRIINDIPSDFGETASVEQKQDLLRPVGVSSGVSVEDKQQLIHQ